MKNNKELFEIMCSHIKRAGFENLLNYINNETDFYVAPASTQYHGSYKGGMLEHGQLSSL